MFELIALLATESSKLSKKDAFTAITGVVDKMSDIKLKGPAGEALTAMSEALGPQFIFTQLHKRAAAQKNPKVLHARSCMCISNCKRAQSPEWQALYIHLPVGLLGLHASWQLHSHTFSVRSRHCRPDLGC